MYLFETLILLTTFSLDEILGHGMLLEPRSRSTLWKFYPVDNVKVVRNYYMNWLSCGGFPVQWENNKGKCGVCGDPYHDSHPQKNENTGLYGKFGTVRSYKSGSVVNVKIKLIVNHRGKFRYSLCKLQDSSRPESGERCFQPLKFADGRTHYVVQASDHVIYNDIKLPDGLRCNRCVLRWEYIGADHYGTCPNGNKKIGCGPQETFRNCADIKIE